MYRAGSVDGVFLLWERSADDVLGERLRRTDGLRGSVGWTSSSGGRCRGCGDLVVDADGWCSPPPARVTEGVLSRCWMHRSLTVCRGMAGAGFQAGVQASAGWPVAAIRWRQGRKRGEMPLNVDRNLCATPTERKLFMVRSRCRVGWADAGADLLAEDLVSGDAVLAERVELGVEFLPER